MLVFALSNVRGGGVSGLLAWLHQCTSFPDADDVGDVQRARHARGDFACCVLVFFETANVSLSTMLVNMPIVKQRQVSMIQR